MLEYDIDYNVYFYDPTKPFDFAEFMTQFNRGEVLVHVHPIRDGCSGDKCNRIVVGIRDTRWPGIYDQLFPRTD